MNIHLPVDSSLSQLLSTKRYDHTRYEPGTARVVQASSEVMEWVSGIERLLQTKLRREQVSTIILNYTYKNVVQCNHKSYQTSSWQQISL